MDVGVGVYVGMGNVGSSVGVAVGVKDGVAVAVGVRVGIGVYVAGGWHCRMVVSSTAVAVGA